MMRLIAASECRHERWKNGGGRTIELARSAFDTNAGADDFRWRVSIAEIEHDGPFSSFPGIARDLMLLEGHGIELDIDDKPPLRLSRRFECAHFEGDARVYCRLLGGVTRDFNVMAHRDTVHAQVIARPLVGPMVIFPQAGVEWLVHVLGGGATARSADIQLNLETGASLHLDFRATDANRVVLDGGGELVLAKFVATI